MLGQLRPALVLLALFTLLTGLAYPLAMTGIAQALFPAAANGSLVMRDGQVVGSSLIGQSFSEAKYFWPRPSATTAPDPADATKTVAAPYNAAASGGSNKGPTAADLMARIAADVARLKAAAPGQAIPVDAVTASGSGLDPHISPAFAGFRWRASPPPASFLRRGWKSWSSGSPAPAPWVYLASPGSTSSS